MGQSKPLRATSHRAKPVHEKPVHEKPVHAKPVHAKPLRATALIVEDDPMQREMICLLLEESHFSVIECESAEAAELVLAQTADNVVLMMADVDLAGHMNGVELAHIAKKYNPDIGVIVTSGRPLRQELPDGAKFWSKPWAPLDVIREAERMSNAWRDQGQG